MDGSKVSVAFRRKIHTVALHVKLLENDGLLQQTTLGTLGVNLLYACKHFYDDPSRFLISLMDNLSPDRFHITALHMSGQDLDYVDNRLLAVQLVKNGMAHAMMFDKHGAAVYKIAGSVKDDSEWKSRMGTLCACNRCPDH